MLRCFCSDSPESGAQVLIVGSVLPRSGFRYVRAGHSSTAERSSEELELLDALLVEITKTDADGDDYMGQRLRQELGRLGVSASTERRTWWTGVGSNKKRKVEPTIVASKTTHGHDPLVAVSQTVAKVALVRRPRL